MPYVGPAPSNRLATAADIEDDAVTAAKIAANAVDSSEITSGSVDIAHLSATGTASSSTFLRGDNSFASAGLSGWSEDGGNNDLLPASASAGIYLGVSSATAANLLDDYEEGTWTPVLWTDSTQPTTSAASMNGRYTKIGRMVEITMTCSFTLSGTGTGTFGISGLPFTSAATHTATGTLTGRGLNEPSTTVTVDPYIPNGNTKIYFNLYDQDAYPSGQSLLQASTLSTSANGANMNISIVYTA